MVADPLCTFEPEHALVCVFVTVNKHKGAGGLGDVGKKQASHLNAEFGDCLVFSGSVSV